MTQIQQTRAASWLPVMIRLTAVGYLLFFVPDLVLASTHHVSGLPPLLARSAQPYQHGRTAGLRSGAAMSG